MTRGVADRAATRTAGPGHYFSLLVLLACLSLASCINLGPDYEQPEADVNEDWREEARNPRITNAALVDTTWWTSAFQDPVLDRLVEASRAEQTLVPWVAWALMVRARAGGFS